MPNTHKVRTADHGARRYDRDRGRDWSNPLSHPTIGRTNRERLALVTRRRPTDGAGTRNLVCVCVCVSPYLPA